jgi:membrane protein
LTLTFLASLALSLWSANSGVKALFDALNVVYEEEEKRNLLWLNVISLVFTVAVIVFLLLSLAAIVVLSPILAQFSYNDSARWLLSISRWPLLVAVVMLGLSALYRFGPSRRTAKWRWVTTGSLMASTTWLVASVAFSWYLANFANYTVTYGSLGAAIGFMIWLWLSAIVVLLGGQLNAEIEHQTARDSTIGPVERPLGHRGAVIADTVGAAQD